MLRSTKSFAQHTPGTIDLEISDPVLMLNEVAKRYESTERVLMEYVDNALDDAEVMYRENDGAYPYPIQILVTVDFKARSIAIQDNCRGMTREVLERVVRNIGESQKRGQSWLNGRFGFGVHAFRAAAESITFQTKHARSSHHGLSLQRSQHRGIKEAKRIDVPFPTDNGTGCLVTLTDIQPDWLQLVTVDSIKTEIERHFERLIARPNLNITVQEIGQEPIACVPFDYEQYAGTDTSASLSAGVSETLHIEYKNETYPITIHLKAATSNTPQRAVSFFARGRRIGAVVDVKSFMRKSVHKTSVWGHPNLMGYIEVGDIVEPIINRDDFVRTRSRTLLYEAILPFEAQLKQQLSGVNEQQREQTFAQFEQVVQQAVTQISDGDGFEVGLAEGEEEKRGWVENGRFTINIAHPDFQARLRTTRQGNPRPSDRLNAYLAAVLAAHHANADIGQIETQLDLMFQIEKSLQMQKGNL